MSPTAPLWSCTPAPTHHIKWVLCTVTWAFAISHSVVELPSIPSSVEDMAGESAKSGLSWVSTSMCLRPGGGQWEAPGGGGQSSKQLCTHQVRSCQEFSAAKTIAMQASRVLLQRTS